MIRICSADCVGESSHGFTKVCTSRVLRRVRARARSGVIKPAIIWHNFALRVPLARNHLQEVFLWDLFVFQETFSRECVRLQEVFHCPQMVCRKWSTNRKHSDQYSVPLLGRDGSGTCPGHCLYPLEHFPATKGCPGNSIRDVEHVAVWLCAHWQSSHKR